MTADSWDYVGAAEDIYRRFDFFSDSLRDARLPAYPALLAVTHPITELHSNRLVLFQIMLGELSVFVSLGFGYFLRSKAAASIMALFIGLNPVYLLFEHTVMTESMFIVVSLIFVAMSIQCLRKEVRLSTGFGLGITAALCILTRSNSLAMCTTLIAGVVIFCFFRSRKEPSGVRNQTSMTKFVFAVCVGAAIFLSPWIWRNYHSYKNISLVNFNYRNLLIFKTMHHPLDYSLPLMQQVNQRIGWKQVDWEWLWRIERHYKTREAEKVARDLLKEQIIANPTLHLLGIAEGFVGYGGFYGRSRNVRNALLTWFEGVVPYRERLDELNTAPESAIGQSSYVYFPIMVHETLDLLWSKIGIAYLKYVRPILYISFFMLWIFFFARYKFARQLIANWQAYVVLLLGLGYISMIFIHAVTLIDGDRFAVVFDWIPALLITLILENIRSNKIKNVFVGSNEIRHE